MTNQSKTNMNQIKQFSYNSFPVSFQLGEDKYVNATEMAKCFGKRPNDWLNLQSTSEFLNTLSITRKNGNSDYQAVTTVRGSAENGGGTWLHEDAAIEFARWLSPEFSIWCNDRIKELMKYGLTATPMTLESILADPGAAAEILLALKDERERNKQLAADNAEKQRKIALDAPKVNYANAVANSETLCTVCELAHILKQHGMNTGQNRLYDLLRRDEYIFKNSCEPTQKSLDLELFRIVESSRVTPSGTYVDRTTKVTQKGKEYFINKYCPTTPSLLDSLE